MNNIVRIEAKRMYMKIIFVFANFIFFAITLFAEVRLPSILGNGMVLQQKTQTNLWGWATSQKKITIVTSWNNRTYTGYSSFDGKWSIEVETPEAGGPYTITISDGQPIELSDVLIGEVWVCAGQSNVQMPVKGFIGQPVIGSCDAIAMASSKEKIRLLTVLRRENSELQEECQSTSWLETTPSNVKEFSAVAYFFAKYIQNILQVPVGIICSAAGGTNIERWMNKNDYLAIYPDKSMDEVDAFLLERMNRSSNKQLNHILEMMIHKRLVQYIMNRLNIDDSLKANETTKVQRRSISELLKCLDFEVSSFAGFDQAMITVGGIKTNQIQPQTMESKKIKGLKFVGEVLDLDAQTGGYNLQIAWTTGYVAGSTIKEGAN